jgi:uncharacterized protein YecE (DUF72 family)
MHHELIHGTSSWSEKSWVGPFYPEGTKPGEFLSHYATRFSAVEADVTYYRIPSPRMVQGWADRTPGSFTLAAKFPRSVVHAGEKAQPDARRLLLRDEVGEEVDRFLEVMSLLGEKCGPLVLQFPYFNKKAFASPGPFLERLDAFLDTLPADFRYAVEVRNRWWVEQPLLEVLRRHDVALVLVDLVYMPHPADLMEKLDLVTTDFAYARLIGDRKAVEKVSKTFDRVVIDMTPRLERWAELLEAITKRVRRTYVFANNHYAGHGPATIEELVGMLQA